MTINYSELENTWRESIADIAAPLNDELLRELHTSRHAILKIIDNLGDHHANNMERNNQANDRQQSKDN